jgi:hypothetical protein
VEAGIVEVIQKIAAYEAEIIAAKNRKENTVFLEQRLLAAETKESQLRNEKDKLRAKETILLQSNIPGTYILL